MRFGLLDARGYDFPIEERYLEFWRRGVSGPGCEYHFCTTGATPSSGALRALSLLGVTALLADPRDPVLHEPGLRVAYDGRDARIYSNDRALPRALVADRQWSSQTDRASPPSRRRLRRPANGRDRACRSGPPVGRGGPFGAGHRDLTAYERRARDGGVAAEATGPAGPDRRFFPGWRPGRRP